MVVRGQSVYTMPRLVSLWYRATRDGADLTTDGLDPAHVVVTRKDAVVSAVQDGKAAVELTVPAGAVVAPQTVAEFVWYVPALADLPVGGTRALAAAEVMTDGGLALHLGQFTFTRVADDAGRRAYDLAGRHGDLDLTGRLVVDADGLPAEVTATVKFGTFVTRRQPVAP